MSDPKPEEPEIPEWARTTERLELSQVELEKIQEIIDSAPQPSERLRAAARRHWQRVQK